MPRRVIPDSTLEVVGRAMNVSNGGSEQRIEFLQGILEIDPKNVAALVELGWSLAEDAHDNARGVIALEQALEIAPDSLEANFWLAKIYYHLLPGNTARAKEALERALATNPSYPAAASLYGSLCWIRWIGRKTRDAGDVMLALR